MFFSKNTTFVFELAAMNLKFHEGQRLSFDGALCTVRYIGKVEGTKDDWLGVEWDDPTRGRHSGEHQGIEYFQCTTSSLHISISLLSLLSR
jgi:dynactin complex subunit